MVIGKKLHPKACHFAFAVLSTVSTCGHHRKNPAQVRLMVVSILGVEDDKRH